MMEKVQITNEQEKMVLEYQNIDRYDLVDFLRDMQRDHNSAFRWFNKNELALIWMGHYEIQKELIEVIKTQLQTCLEEGEPNEYYNGYMDALLYCIRVIESRNVGDKS
ncbi:hypothetical protein [Lysinibacillus phage vB_LspM-01]|nr:hypothetical protein [Lysinibacillus phage vB_LspM-01]